MKKYLSITSVLLLAACAGGSGHHGGATGLVSDDVLASNRQVTNMASQILVKNGDSSKSIVRSSSKVYNGTEYAAYDLSDVKFSLADEGFDKEAFVFLVNDKGEIYGIDMGLAQEESYPADGPKYIKREEKNKFSGLVNDEGWIPANLEYHSEGGTLNLRYSDFGYIDIDAREFWRPVFIGGYDDAKEIATNAVNSEIQLDGRVVGHVMAVKGGPNSGEALPLEATAKLTLNEGNSKLEADFLNWYKIVYEENGDVKTVAFSEFHRTDDDFRMVSDTGSGVTLDNSVTQYDPDEDITMNNLNSDIRYFGDNGNVSEAVGLIQLRDCGGQFCNNDHEHQQEVRMNIGFGAVR